MNGEPRRLPEGCSVADLLELLEREGALGGAAVDGAEKRPAHSVAVAVNREVVPRSRFAERVLGAGDRVEILEAVGGG